MSKELIITPSLPEYWERIYQSGDMGWDLNGPTPIFDHWIDTYDIALSICVLGAGNGWDALRFAEKGQRNNLPSVIVVKFFAQQY